DVCPLTIENCGCLHSTSITRLLRYADSHPKPDSLLPFSLSRLFGILGVCSAHPKNCLAAWLASVHRVLLDAV
ncbi:MAG: hypothetical protein ACRD6N_09880, partial [Pyrinomonadaceae bacterium]